MIQARFTDNLTIALFAPDGEKFIWKTLFPTPLQKQEYVAEKLAYYFEKYFKDNIGEKTGMGMQYWIWIKMNYDEEIAIQGGKGEKEDERIFLQQERVRIGGRIRELRKEKNIEARIVDKNQVSGAPICLKTKTLAGKNKKKIVLYYLHKITGIKWFIKKYNEQPR